MKYKLEYEYFCFPEFITNDTLVIWEKEIIETVSDNTKITETVSDNTKATETTETVSNTTKTITTTTTI
jgi:hypothetical protein